MRGCVLFLILLILSGLNFADAQVTGRVTVLPVLENETVLVTSVGSSSFSTDKVYFLLLDAEGGLSSVNFGYYVYHWETIRSYGMYQYEVEFDGTLYLYSKTELLTRVIAPLCNCIKE